MLLYLPPQFPPLQLFAPLLATELMDTATVVQMTSQGTGFMTGSGLALMASMVEAAMAVPDSKFVLNASVPLWPLLGPCYFDSRGNSRAVAAALAVPAFAAHPQVALVSKMAQWRADTDRKSATETVAAWNALSAAERCAPAAAHAILQLVSDATSMSAGKADVNTLKINEEAVKAIAADGSAADAELFSGFLLEGTVRTVKCEAAYAATAHGEIASAFVAYLVSIAVLSAANVKAWKAATTAPFVSVEHLELSKLVV
jgi:hypothetical protein